MNTAALSNNIAQAATKVQVEAPYLIDISWKTRKFVASRKSVLLGTSFLIFSNSEKMQPSADTANMNDKAEKIALAKVVRRLRLTTLASAERKPSPAVAAATAGNGNPSVRSRNFLLSIDEKNPVLIIGRMMAAGS
ncbi:hypothetical protein CSIM01_07567 [Colletotrichum simmondsii]|uniref:Uncharacterized protein n=1 Tax=Colletotrichum simmondsii TaxID=703756 RepID=A0A135SAJ4_9PEZI|nr:hypothetical protein CSIM01_07567 [Colletotrichum simmondsii]